MTVSIKLRVHLHSFIINTSLCCNNSSHCLALSVLCTSVLFHSVLPRHTPGRQYYNFKEPNTVIIVMVLVCGSPPAVSEPTPGSVLQDPSWWAIGGHTGCRGSHLGQLRARQLLLLPHYLSSPHVFKKMFVFLFHLKDHDS